MMNMKKTFLILVFFALVILLIGCTTTVTQPPSEKTTDITKNIKTELKFPLCTELFIFENVMQACDRSFEPPTGGIPPAVGGTSPSCEISVGTNDDGATSFLRTYETSESTLGYNYEQTLQSKRNDQSISNVEELSNIGESAFQYTFSSPYNPTVGVYFLIGDRILAVESFTAENPSLGDPNAYCPLEGLKKVAKQMADKIQTANN